jgi:uncharacterized protein with von Willebrand factor type A (vWA) domain
MSIFGNIASAIFGTSKGTPPPAGLAGGSSSAASSTASGQEAPTAATGKPVSREELEAMIEKIANDQDENFNWDESIVDLMKLLKLDSSLAARKQLAQELGYKGKLDGSADMNVWLHEQVMTKLAESGGKVPESLKGI